MRTTPLSALPGLSEMLLWRQAATPKIVARGTVEDAGSEADAAPRPAGTHPIFRAAIWLTVARARHPFYEESAGIRVV